MGDIVSGLSAVGSAASLGGSCASYGSRSSGGHGTGSSGGNRASSSYYDKPSKPKQDKTFRVINRGGVGYRATPKLSDRFRPNRSAEYGAIVHAQEVTNDGERSWIKTGENEWLPAFVEGFGIGGSVLKLVGSPSTDNITQPTTQASSSCVDKPKQSCQTLNPRITRWRAENRDTEEPKLPVDTRRLAEDTGPDPALACFGWILMLIIFVTFILYERRATRRKRDALLTPRRSQKTSTPMSYPNH